MSLGYYIINEDDYVLIDPFAGRYIEYFADEIIARGGFYGKETYLHELYKRLYHSLPFLVKTKGTERGLRALINCFGVPSDILDITVYSNEPKTQNQIIGQSYFTQEASDRITIHSESTYISGSTLSTYTSIRQPVYDYSTNYPIVEVGFSPTKYLDSFIKTLPNTSVFNINDYIGDPRNNYSSSYKELNNFIRQNIIPEVETGYNLSQLTNHVRFFDNALFRMIKDFVPYTVALNAGIIYQSNLLHRNKLKQVRVDWSDQRQLVTTGSLFSNNFSIEGETETSFTTGDSGGSNSNYLSGYTQSLLLPEGGTIKESTLQGHNKPSFTGEYDGTTITVSTVDLNKDNIFKKVEPNTFRFRYLPIPEKFGKVLYAFYVNTGPNGTSEGACLNTNRGRIVYGERPVLKDNDILYTNSEGTDFDINIISNDFFSDGKTYVKLEPDTGIVLLEGNCPVPQTTYSFNVIRDKRNGEDSKGVCYLGLYNISSSLDSNYYDYQELTIYGHESLFQNNTYFFNSVGYPILGNGNYYVHYDDGSGTYRYVSLNNGEVVDSGACSSGTTPELYLFKNVLVYKYLGLADFCRPPFGTDFLSVSVYGNNSSFKDCTELYSNYIRSKENILPNSIYRLESDIHIIDSSKSIYFTSICT